MMNNEEHAPKRRPDKLLVGNNESHACHMMSALGLDPAEWKPIGVGSGCTGGYFVKVVDLANPPRSELEADMRMRWLEIVSRNVKP